MPNADFDTRPTNKLSCAATDPNGPTGGRGSTTLRGEGTRTMVACTERVRNEVILAARVLLILLFVVFGWSKLTDYSGTVGYMAQTGVPLPSIAAVVAIVVEVFVALAVAFGAWTRPLALLLAFYTLGTALIGHPFWAMKGADRDANAINFYKNISIIGGFVLLYVTGPGRYSVEAMLRARRARKHPV